MIVQGQERDEVLILRAQPTGFLQGTPVLQQIVTDCSLVRVQATAVGVERKVVEVPPIIRTQWDVGTGLGKVFEQSFRCLVHRGKVSTRSAQSGLGKALDGVMNTNI